MVSAFCENARKQTQSVCLEAEAVAMKSPVRNFFADTPKEKLWYNRIIWKKLSCFMGLEIRRN